MRLALAGLLLVLVGTATCGCGPAADGSTATTAVGRIHTDVSGVSPFPPSNSAWYSSATLRAERPFARWEQDRDRIEIVTWPRSCDRVPTGLSFAARAHIVHVELGPAPRSVGPRRCSPGQVLTSTFLASRALQRDLPTTLVLDGHRVELPAAPVLRVEPASHEVRPGGVEHPLEQIDRPLPQYSVRDYPWTLAAPVTPISRSISIGWIGGTCQTNASIAYVVESDSAVTIDTALAFPPIRPRPARAAGTSWCAGVGRSLTATIHLERPLGGRMLMQHQWVPRPSDQDAY